MSQPAVVGAVSELLLSRLLIEAKSSKCSGTSSTLARAEDAEETVVSADVGTDAMHRIVSEVVDVSVSALERAGNDRRGSTANHLASQLAISIGTVLSLDPSLLTASLDFIVGFYKSPTWVERQEELGVELPCRFILEILKGLNFRLPSERDVILETLVSKCDVPEALKASTLSRYRVRRNQLLCKSLMPRSASQAPGAAAAMTLLLRRVLLASLSSSTEASSSPTDHHPLFSAESIAAIKKELASLISSSQMHLQLLFTILKDTLMTFYAPFLAARSGSSSSSSRARNSGYRWDTSSVRLASLFPPEIITMISGGIVEFLPASFVDAFPVPPAPQPSSQPTTAPVSATTTAASAAKSAQTLAGNAEEQDRKLKCTIVAFYIHGFLSLRECVALFFGALFYGPQPTSHAVDSAAMQIALLDETMKRAAAFAADLDAFVRSTRSEAIIAATSDTALGSRSGPAHGASKKLNSNGNPMTGDVVAPSLFQIVHDAPPPTWNDLLSKAEATKIPFRTVPLAILQILLSMRCFAAAATYIEEFKSCGIASDFGPIDLFQYAGDGVEVTAATMIAEAVKEFLGEAVAASDRKSVRHAFANCSELLKVSISHISNVPLVWFLLQAAEVGWPAKASQPTMNGSSSCGSSGDDDDEEQRDVLLQLVGRVILPSFRAVAPCPPLYEALHALFRKLRDDELLGDKNPISVSLLVPKSPREAVAFKELEVGFNSALRRMTLDTVAKYRAANLRLLYGYPAFVCERLFQQAIGYENAQLAIHSQLLAGAPAPILTIFLLLGLQKMRQYAVEQKDGCEARIGHIATLLCVVWRLNPGKFDGAIAIREVERSLRRDARDSVLFAHELLKAVSLQLLGTCCEHEEQYNAAQLGALGLFGTLTRWFGRGGGASFMCRWHPLYNNPEMMFTARIYFAKVFNEAIPVIDKRPRPCSEGQTGSTMSLGANVILHLARLSASLYDSFADMPGTMETILNECSKQYNTAIDLLHIFAPYVKDLPSTAALKRVATPAVFLSLATTKTLLGSNLPSSLTAWTTGFVADANLFDVLVAKTQQRADMSDGDAEVEVEVHPTATSPSESGVNETAQLASLVCCVASLRPWHLEFDPQMYASVALEVTAMSNRLSEMITPPGSSSTGANRVQAADIAGSLTWLTRVKTIIANDNSTHETAFNQMAPIAEALLREHVLPWIARDPLEFVRVCILPRSLLSLEDAMFCVTLFRRLLSISGTTVEAHSNVIDAMLCYISCVMSLFVAYADGECKRAGTVVGGLIQLLDGEVSLFRAQAAEAASKRRRSGNDEKMVPAKAGQVNNSNNNSKNHKLALALRLNEAWVKRNTAIAMNVTPAFALDCDVFLAESFYQILSTSTAPALCFRNAFILLDRMKGVFPRTPEAAALMALAMKFHSDKNSAYFAAATAQMKLLAPLLSNAKGSEAPSYMAEKLKPIHDAIAAKLGGNSASADIEGARLEAERIAAEMASAEGVDVSEINAEPDAEKAGDAETEAEAAAAAEIEDDMLMPQRSRSASREGSSRPSSRGSSVSSRSSSLADDDAVPADGVVANAEDSIGAHRKRQREDDDREQPLVRGQFELSNDENGESELV